MKLTDLIRLEKQVHDYGHWASGDIDRAAWPMRKKKLRQSSDWYWRVIRLTAGDDRHLRILLKLNPGIEQFYAILGEVSGDGIAVLCSHDLHTSHGDWHCHATLGKVEDVFVGAWRDKDSLRRWPEYSGVSRVVFEVTRGSALQVAATLYRFDMPPQAEMFG